MSKHCLRAVALTFATAAPWLYAGPQNINPGGEGPDFRPPQPILSDRGDCGSDTITQSNNPNVIGAATVICGDAETSAEFSLARRFVAPSTMTVECVTFGVRLNVGPAWTAHVRLLVGDLLGPYDALTVLADEVVAIPADSDFDFYTVSMPGVVLPAGTEFMVELLSPSRFPADGGDGGLLGFGCNVQGQSAPTFYRGPACGDPDFIDLASIGFAGRHLVMTLGVSSLEGSLLAGGFLHVPIGGSTLTYLDTEVLVAGDPNGEPMGASIVLGDLTSGGGAGAIEWPHLPASTLSVSFKGRMRDDFTFAYSTKDSIRLDTDFDSTAFEVFDVAVFLEGDLVGILKGESAGTLEIIAPPAPDPAERLITNWHLSYIWCFPVAYGTKFERTGYHMEFAAGPGAPLTFAGANGTFAGDAIEIRPGGTGTQPTTGPIAVDVTAVGLSEFQLLLSESGASVLFGSSPTQPRCEFDQVVSVSGLQVFKQPRRTPNDTMVVSGADVDTDGVADLVLSGIGLREESIALNFGGVESGGVDFQIVDPAPTGACLTLRAVQIGGDDGGTVAFDPCVGCPPPFKGEWNLVGDFSGVGSGTYRLELVLDGMVVHQEPGMSGLAGVSIGAPSKAGKLGGATPCWRLCWPNDTPFLFNGQSYMIDEVRLLAEGNPTLNPLDMIEVTPANIAELILSNPQTVLPDFDPPCPGDTNGDGIVDFADLNAVLSSFNTATPGPGYNPAADFDGDGFVNFSDLNTLLGAFNTACP